MMDGLRSGSANEDNRPKGISKAATGISGFDEITLGGLPRGRPSLIAGGAGSGKTVFAMEFIIHGATRFNEPGIFVSFEENLSELKKNFASLGYDLDKLVEEKKIYLDHIFMDRNLLLETGEYDLDAMFFRLGYLIDSIGAKRIALDTIEVLFSGLTNHAVLRSELIRLFRWLKDRGVTAVVTGEKGEKSITRFGLEEYVADCVVYLDSRVSEQITTRRLRVIKYRGSVHGPDEYPFLITRDGITIFPITSVKTNYKISRERISTGIESLDNMLGEKGFFRGSSVLLSGSAGTGKTSFAGVFVDAACRRGEKSLYIAMEETQDQICRNLESIGLDLEQWVEKGLLDFYITRPSHHGLEMHLAMIEDLLNKHSPAVAVIDPMTDFLSVGGGKEVKSLLTRLIDLMKSKGVTIILTDLIKGDVNPEKSNVYISSLIDTWILLRNEEYNGERSRGLTIIKSRGMPHSNQIREFTMSNNGITLVQPYIGPEGVFMGSARVIQEAKDKADMLVRQRSIQQKRDALEEKHREYEAKIAALQAQFNAEEKEISLAIEQAEHDLNIKKTDRKAIATVRKADEVTDKVGEN